MSSGDLDLILFAASADLVRQGLAAGIGALIVDWEWRGKEERQAGSDTEINRDTPEDLARLAALGVPRRLCRINRVGPWTPEEVEAALASGATRILVPMVETPREVESVLGRVAGRCEVGILVETERGVAAAGELARLAPASVYLGLNDLAISRGAQSIFEALTDGTVERVRAAFGDLPFGFGGVTVVDRGEPVAAPLLLAEMARVGCSFSFLRRSFRRDIRGRDWPAEVGRIRDLWQGLLRRTDAEVESDRRALAAAVAAASGAARA